MKTRISLALILLLCSAASGRFQPDVDPFIGPPAPVGLTGLAGDDEGAQTYLVTAYDGDDEAAGSAAFYTGNAARTLVMWLDDTNGGMPVSLTTAGNPGFDLRIGTGELFLDGSTARIDFGSVPDVTEWTCYIVTYDGLGSAVGNFQMSINGVDQGTPTLTVGAIPNPMLDITGIRLGLGNVGFTGRETQIALHAGAWSLAEQQAYVANPPFDMRDFAASGTIIGYWQMQKVSDTAIRGEVGPDLTFGAGATSPEFEDEKQTTMPPKE